MAEILNNHKNSNNANIVLAVVNYNSVDTWLEPYIGMTPC